MCILIRYRHPRCGQSAKNPDALNPEKYGQQYEPCDRLLDLQDRYRDQYYESIVPTAPCGYSLELDTEEADDEYRDSCRMTQMRDEFPGVGIAPGQWMGRYWGVDMDRLKRTWYPTWRSG